MLLLKNEKMRREWIGVSSWGDTQMLKCSMDGGFSDPVFFQFFI